jgi:hypothetical protein
MCFGVEAGFDVEFGEKKLVVGRGVPGCEDDDICTIFFCLQISVLISCRKIQEFLLLIIDGLVNF